MVCKHDSKAHFKLIQREKQRKRRNMFWIYICSHLHLPNVRLPLADLTSVNVTCSEIPRHPIKLQILVNSMKTLWLKYLICILNEFLLNFNITSHPIQYMIFCKERSITLINRLASMLISQVLCSLTVMYD